MSDNHELGPLLSRVLAGDRLALERLLANLRPYLHLLVRQQLDPDPWDKLGGSDIVQETLMRIDGGLSRGSPEDGGQFRGSAPPAFLAWVSQIVRHRITDAQRQGKAKRRDQGRERPGSKIFATLLQGSNPEESVERAERAMVLAAALARLPAHKREIIEWRFFLQLSFEEISQRTRKSVEALRTVCCRALKDLRNDPELRGLMEEST